MTDMRNIERPISSATQYEEPSMEELAAAPLLEGWALISAASLPTKKFWRMTMLNDDELNHFREQYLEIVIRPHRESGHQIGVWNDLLWQANGATISAFLDDPSIPDDVAGPFLGLLSEIGIAFSADVLHGTPLPIDYEGASMRRWQLKRELQSLIERMTDAQLQMFVFHAQGMLA